MMYQNWKARLVVRIIITFLAHTWSLQWFPRFCWLYITNSAWSDLRGHVTDGTTQLLPLVCCYWLFGLGANQLITQWRANPPPERLNMNFMQI